MDKLTQIIRKRYDRTARYYDLADKMMEMGGKMTLWRKELWGQARGHVLEVGVGTGKNIAFYPENVQVTAIDFSGKMLEKARQRAVKLNKLVTLLEMDIQALEFPDESFDTVISTCVFCSVPDPVRGLLEVKRVCKKDGQILMLEHVRSSKNTLGLIMDLMNPLSLRIIGSNINRKTVDNLLKAGLTVDHEQNLLWDVVKHLHCHKE